MALPLRSFQTMVQSAVAATQSACSSLLDLTDGSPLLALIRASGGMYLWLQYLTVRVLRVTRLGTSQGADVDSFGADFSFVRLPGSVATGAVTLSRFTATSAAFVVPYVNADGSFNTSGATLKTMDGTQTFLVTANVNNSAWSAPAGGMPGYSVAPTQFSITVPVQAAAVGSAGNVAAGAITQLATDISGISTVSNALPLTNGVDAESDAAMRLRFQYFILGLSKATETAVIAAAMGVQQGLFMDIVEGAPGSGIATLYVDDGTGAPSASLITDVFAAVQPVRPVGVMLNVLPAIDVPVSINAIIVTASGVSRAALASTAETAITAYIDALPLGATLPYLTLPQVILNADPNITAIGTLTVNGATADIVGSPGQAIRASSVTVA